MGKLTRVLVHIENILFLIFFSHFLHLSVNKVILNVMPVNVSKVYLFFSLFCPTNRLRDSTCITFFFSLLFGCLLRWESRQTRERRSIWLVT